MRRWRWARAAMWALLSLAGWWRASRRGRLSRATTLDRTFMRHVLESDLLEVELGRLAQKRGMADDVREFGGQMVQDHSRALQDLQTLGSELGVDLPATWQDAAPAVFERLLALSEQAFDDAYIQEMIRQHEDGLDLAERVSRDAELPQLRHWSRLVTPIWASHLEMAREMARRRQQAA